MFDIQNNKNVDVTQLMIDFVSSKANEWAATVVPQEWQ